MAETKKFKTESKRLLDLMVNSIYTNREIFLRELISNASDAIDKYHLLSLTDEKLEKRSDYEIHLTVDKKKRTLTVTDNGIGMTHDELVDHLGTIASSGSRDFLDKISDENIKKDANIIGQFGVGFYSAFMVAKKVLVETQSPYSDKAYSFTSDGTESYTLNEIEKAGVGTSITLFLRDDKEEEKYDEFLDQYTLESLVKKYSDYIRYPIKMEVTESIPQLDKDGKEIEDKFDEKKVIKTLNSMIPLWRKGKKEVSDEELIEFYKSKFNDFDAPLRSAYVSVEGLITYNALLFIPSHAPYNLYSESYERGLKLYAKGVFIMDACKDLVPMYLRFMKGLVDSDDLSLNISREMLQQDKQLKKIADSLEKRMVGELEKMKNGDADKYAEFFKLYGINLKYGIYESFGARKDTLKDLVLFTSVNQEKAITLKQYVEAMVKDQKVIYYASAKSKDAVKAMPQMDKLKKAGFDVLVLTEDIDEFMLSMMGDYDGKLFKNINQGDLEILSKEEEEKYNLLKDEKKPFLEKMKELLNGKVTDVVLSKRLSDSAVCLVSGEGNVSFGMEKAIAATQSEEKAKADKILELNPNHALFQAIEKAYDKNSANLGEYANLIYAQALLIEGFPLENPVEFANSMNKLLIENVNQ